MLAVVVTGAYVRGEVNKNGVMDKNESKHTQMKMLSTTTMGHQLIRGVGRSGSLLRASRQLHSAVATTLGGIINQNLIPPTSSVLIHMCEREFSDV